MKKVICRLLLIGTLLSNQIIFAGQVMPGRIHKVAATGTVEEMRQLLSAGVKINELSEWGKPPLFIAVQRVRPEMVQFLVNNGADKTFRFQGNSAHDWIRMYKCNGQLCKGICALLGDPCEFIANGGHHHVPGGLQPVALFPEIGDDGGDEALEPQE